MLNKTLHHISFYLFAFVVFLVCTNILADTDVRVSLDNQCFDPACFFDLEGIGFRKDNAHFNKGWLGIFMENAEDQGILIKELTKGSPAAVSGLKAGDIITKMNNETTTGKDNSNLVQFKKTIETIGAGGAPELTVSRNGTEMVFQPKLIAKLLKGIANPVTPFIPEVFSEEEMRKAPDSDHAGICFIDFALKNEKYRDMLGTTLQRIGEEAYAREDFQSDTGTNTFRLSIINYLLLHPFATPGIGRFIRDKFSGADAGTQIEFTAKLLDLPSSGKDENTTQSESLQKQMQSLINTLPVSVSFIKEAFHNVPREEFDFLYHHADKIWIPEEKTDTQDLAKFLTLSRKADLAKIFEATAILLSKIPPEYLHPDSLTISSEQGLNGSGKHLPETSRDRLSPFQLPKSLQQTNTKDTIKEKLEGTCDFGGDILFVQDTTIGKIVVGGTGTSYYYADAALIIDLGGDDYYFNNAGASNKDMPAAICIDLSGNDVYETTHPFTQGTGWFGTGILIDLKGNDKYVSQNFSQGSGLFGVGLLLDKEGDDFYSGHVLNQGTGFFGTGLLDDLSGNDVYFSRQFAQGVGLTKGVGALIDYRGNDFYFTGGEYPDFRDPEKSFQSMSQGTGMGIRPEETIVGASGGIGVLIDQKGTDRYHGDYFSQGSGYYYSLGYLCDKEGSDRYYAGRYAQGAGIHSAVGLLEDASGDDTYECTLGVAQGCGHDTGIGFLLDEGGNDLYRSETTSQGVALEKGLGVLADFWGNDAYYANGNSQGFSSPSKTEEINSIGILLDNQGDRDIFHEPIPDNLLLYRLNGGVVLNR